jgi:hypothetical protein
MGLVLLIYEEMMVLFRSYRGCVLPMPCHPLPSFGKNIKTRDLRGMGLLRISF